MNNKRSKTEKKKNTERIHRWKTSSRGSSGRIWTIVSDMVVFVVIMSRRKCEFDEYISEHNTLNNSIDIVFPEETYLLPKSSSHYKIDEHLTPLGHKRLGEALVKNLKKNKIN